MHHLRRLRRRNSQTGRILRHWVRCFPRRAESVLRLRRQDATGELTRSDPPDDRLSVGRRETMDNMDRQHAGPCREPHNVPLRVPRVGNGARARYRRARKGLVRPWCREAHDSQPSPLQTMKTRTSLHFFPRVLSCTPTAPRCDGGATLKPAGTDVCVDLILLNGRLLARSLDAPAWCFCDRADLVGDATESQQGESKRES